MEIEVGEYVRTEYGISKVIENVDKYVKDNQICVDFIGGMYHQVIYKDKIAKHSKNIIDLIEVGDYVNGKCCIDIEEIETDDGRRNLNLICIGGSILELSNEIKSIVTKEQFKNVEYIV